MKKQIVIFILTIILFITEFFSLIVGIFNEGLHLFDSYSKDSNLILCISSLFLLIYFIRYFWKKKEIPCFVKQLFYVSICLTTFNFIVTLCVIIPTSEENGFYRMFFYMTGFYEHLLCPLLGIAIYFLLIHKKEISRNLVFTALIPTLVYTVVISLFNFLKWIEGPYTFLKVYEQPLFISFIWLFALLSISYGVNYLLYYLKSGGHNGKIRKSKS